jgi:hypothetical protein
MALETVSAPPRRLMPQIAVVLSLFLVVGCGGDSAIPTDPSAPPTLTAIAPESGTQGTTLSVTVTGTNFVVEEPPGLTVTPPGITVSDVVVQNASSVTATLTIAPDAPLGDRAITATNGTSTGVTFTVTAPEPAAGVLSASPATIVAGAAATLSWTGIANATSCTIDQGVGTVSCNDGSVVVRPVSTTTYTLLAASEGGQSQASVTVTVNLNEAPSFTAGTDQTVDEDMGPQSVAFWATDISAGPTNENSQTVSFTIASNTNAALFSAGPAVAADGTLTYTPADDAFGTATITLQAEDDGGTAEGGVDTSATQQFTITVTQLFDDSQTFDFTGGNQFFVVPDGVTQIRIQADGAQAEPIGTPGLGGSVTATIRVTPSETLTVVVGGANSTNGGGLGGGGTPGGANGGGASDVRQGGSALGNRVVVAGGGGAGFGGSSGGHGGGALGGSAGSNGVGGNGGAGGTTVAGAGGAGTGANGSPGQSGTGGNGASGGVAGAGCGGGGGFFGGGGGGAGIIAGDTGGGGGGGSSYTAPGAIDVTHQQGVRSGNGRVIIMQ